METQKDIEKMENGKYKQALLDSSATLDEDIKANSYMKYLDIFLSCTVLCIPVVVYWNSGWVLFDIYQRYFPIYESLCMGIFIHLVFALSQDFFHDLFVETKSNNVFRKCMNWICHKIYFQVFFLGNVLHWGGGFKVFDHLCKVETDDFNLFFAVAFFVCTFALLMSTRAVKNLITSPMTVQVDTKSEYFIFNAQYFKIEERKALYVLDCLFSIAVVGTLVVFVWRGVWLLVDIFLFPEDLVFSYWSSLVIGYSCVAVAFLLQPAMRHLCERLTGAARLLTADLYVLFALFGTVNVWRGIWNLLNVYFLPDNLELSCWITHWVSLIILILCRCSNSLLVRGVYIDAEEPGGECAIFPCYYLRIILRKKKLKKLNLNAVTLNDIIKVNQKDAEGHNNHVINI